MTSRRGGACTSTRPTVGLHRFGGLLEYERLDEWAESLSKPEFARAPSGGRHDLHAGDLLLAEPRLERVDQLAPSAAPSRRTAHVDGGHVPEAEVLRCPGDVGVTPADAVAVQRRYQVAVLLVAK